VGWKVFQVGSQPRDQAGDHRRLPRRARHVSVDVIAQGVIAFVLDASGEQTGEKLFVLSLDAAALTEEGTLVGEFHKTCGERRGHGDPIFCSGSFMEQPGVTVFFDVLVTRR
jgi:hypothetical protein